MLALEMAAEKKSSFSATCSLMSQYLKEKRRSSGELGLFDHHINIAAAPEGGSTISGMYRQHYTTLNLLPGLDVSAENQADAENSSNSSVSIQETAATLTIFYGGKVTVFENMSTEKVADLMNLACKGSSCVTTAPSSTLIPSNLSEIHIPIARKASLQRFLQKRKDRIIAKAPYQVLMNASSKRGAKTEVDDSGSWLALGL